MGKPKLENFSGEKCCGKKNPTSKNIAIIAEKLNDLNFVSHIILGNPKPSSQKPEMKVIGYDIQKRQYHLTVHGGKFSQKISLNVSYQDENYMKKKILACGPS